MDAEKFCPVALVLIRSVAWALLIFPTEVYAENPSVNTVPVGGDGQLTQTPKAAETHADPEVYDALFAAVCAAYPCVSSKPIPPELPSEFREVQAKAKELEEFLRKIRTDAAVVGGDEANFGIVRRMNNLEVTVVQHKVRSINPRWRVVEKRENSQISESEGWGYRVQEEGTCFTKSEFTTVNKYYRRTERHHAYITAENGSVCYICFPEREEWRKAFLLIGDKPVAACEFTKEEPQSGVWVSPPRDLEVDLARILKEMMRLPSPLKPAE